MINPPTKELEVDSNEEFGLLHTEAFLLGAVFGEYCEAEDVRFFELVRRKLRHICPDYGYLTENYIAESEIPDDAHSLEFDDGETVWVSNKVPLNVFTQHREQSGIRRIEWKPERKSLIDRLFLEFGECIELSRAEQLLCKCGTSPGIQHQWNTIVQIFQAGRGSASNFFPASRDDRSQIELHLRRITRSFSNCFHIGRLFGEAEVLLMNLVEELHSYTFEEIVEKYISPSGESAEALGNGDDESVIVFSNPALSQVKQLLQQSIVLRSPACENALTRVCECFEYSWNEWFGGTIADALENGDNGEFLLEEAIECWRHLLYAFSDVMGRLRAEDVTCPGTESESLFERMIDWRSNNVDSIDWNDADLNRLRGVVNRAFDALLNPKIHPIDVVRMIAYGVEPLAKRAWTHEDFSKGYVNVAKRKRISRNQRESTFANTLLTIHYCFRNPVYHENKSCSVHEAKFVVASLQLLIDLLPQINPNHAPRD